MRRRMRLVFMAAAAVMVFAVAGSRDVRAEKSPDDTIMDRVYIGEVDVGGMTEEEATDAVEEYIQVLSDRKITLRVNDRKVSVKAKQLGITWENRDVVKEAAGFGKSGNLIARYKAKKDLEHEDKVFMLSLSTDEEQTTNLLEKKSDKLNRKAVDFGLKRENGEFVVTGGKEGIELDIEESVGTIRQYLAKGWQEEADIELAANVTKPRGSEEELAKVKDKLGSFATNYASSASGRKANIANGCGKIKGSLIYPGEVFSVSDALAPFTADNGYELAGAYENGTTVESYGGGICQVSTTLYNAVIRAELEIVERYGHSMAVAYVDPSADAAIADGLKDFKFKNNLDAPIFIDGYADGATIGFSVYGVETRPENREVSFVSETLETTEPTVKFEASGDKIGTISKTQSSHTGKKAQLWKIVKVDGAEESREVFNKTTYKMSPTIYSVGISSSNKEAVAAMKKAIATKDEKKIRAAAAKWNDKALKKEEEKKKKEEEKQKEKEEAANKDDSQEAESE